MNMASLPNKEDLRFHVDRINNQVYDSGAHSYHYLKNNPQISVKKYPLHGSLAFKNEPDSVLYLAGFNDDEIALTRALPEPLRVEFHIDHHFIHFRGVSFHQAGKETKERLVIEFLHRLLEKD
jgi:hypothetical protein